jgi:hypothetical protein
VIPTTVNPGISAMRIGFLLVIGKLATLSKGAGTEVIVHAAIRLTEPCLRQNELGKSTLSVQA